MSAHTESTNLPFQLRVTKAFDVGDTGLLSSRSFGTIDRCVGFIKAQRWIHGLNHVGMKYVKLSIYIGADIWATQLKVMNQIGKSSSAVTYVRSTPATQKFHYVCICWIVKIARGPILIGKKNDSFTLRGTRKYPMSTYHVTYLYIYYIYIFKDLLHTLSICKQFVCTWQSVMWVPKGP